MTIQEEIMAGSFDQIVVEHYPYWAPEYYRLHTTVWLPSRSGKIKMSWRSNSDWMTESAHGILILNLGSNGPLDVHSRGHHKIGSEFALFLDNISQDALMLDKLMSDVD